MPYDDLVIYINNFNRNKIQADRELIRLLIQYMFQCSPKNFKEIPKASKILQCDSDDAKRVKVDTDQLRKEVESLYKSLIVE